MIPILNIRRAWRACDAHACLVTQSAARVPPWIIGNIAASTHRHLVIVGNGTALVILHIIDEVRSELGEPWASG